MADRTPQRDQDPALTPDELEQRQRADGSFDEPDDFGDVADTDTPLTPDVLEQRQVVEDDEEEPPAG